MSDVDNVQAQQLISASAQEEQVAGWLKNGAMYLQHLLNLIERLEDAGRHDRATFLREQVVAAMGGVMPEADTSPPVPKSLTIHNLPKAAVYPHGAPAYNALNYALTFLELFYKAGAPMEPPRDFEGALIAHYGRDWRGIRVNVPKSVSAKKWLTVGEIANLDGDQIGDCDFRNALREAFVNLMHVSTGTYPSGYGKPHRQIEEAAVAMNTLDIEVRRDMLATLIRWGVFDESEQIDIGEVSG